MNKSMRSFARFYLAAVLLGGMVSARAELLAPGITQALREVHLSLGVGGKIEKVLVSEGQPVKQGALLLYLDRELEELEIRRRKILVEDSAKLREYGLRRETLKSQVAEAKLLLDYGGVSRKQVEDETIALEAATAEYQALAHAKRREKVELDLARTAYERRHLRAPIDGVVTKILLRAGESVSANDPLIALVDVSRVRFTGTFPVSAGVMAKAGQPVTIRLGQDATATHRSGVLVFVSPVADPASGLVEIMAEFDNRDGSIRPGISGFLVLDQESDLAAKDAH
jgi:RND family efflux transporter MFP subunit